MNPPISLEKTTEARSEQLTFWALAILVTVLPWSLALMQIAFGVVCTAFLYAAIIGTNSRNFRSSLTLLVAAYILVRILSAIMSADPGKSFISILRTDWVILAVPLIGSSSLSTKKTHKVLQILAISGAIAGIYGIIQFFWGYEVFRSKNLASMGKFFRATGGYNFYLTYAGNQLMIFAVVLGLFFSEKTWTRTRKYYLLGTIILFLSIVATFARSTWLAIIVVIAVGTLLVDRRKFWIAMAAVVGAVFVASMISPEIKARIISIVDLSQNENRFNLWLTSFNMISAHPFFGIGPGLFNTMFPIFKVPGYYDAFGHSHNDYINLAVNSGIPALLVWLGIWVVWFRQSVKTLLKAGSEAVQRRGILLGSIMAISGIMFAAIFQCYYTDLENNLMWWTVALMAVLQSSRE